MEETRHREFEVINDYIRDKMASKKLDLDYSYTFVIPCLCCRPAVPVVVLIYSAPVRIVQMGRTNRTWTEPRMLHTAVG